VQERVGTELKHIGIGSNFLNRTSIVQQLRERINKWEYVRVKSFCRTKEKVNTG
jgi:hypothetical protein